MRGRQEVCWWLDQEFGAAKEYSDKFEGKKKRMYDEYKTSVQCTSKNKKVKHGWQVKDATSSRKVGGAQICLFHHNKMWGYYCLGHILGSSQFY